MNIQIYPGLKKPIVIKELEILGLFPLFVGLESD